MQFSLIVSIPNISNSGEFLKPTDIWIRGDAKSPTEYSFDIYWESSDTSLQKVTDLYIALLGTDLDVDSRFTDPIEQHLSTFFKN